MQTGFSFISSAQIISRWHASHTVNQRRYAMKDTNARDPQSLIDFMVNATGGQMHYRGRDMGVGKVEGEEVLGFLDSLKGDIVAA
jgi:hypothetical protein